MLPASESAGAVASDERCVSQSVVVEAGGVEVRVPLMLVTICELVVAIVAILVMVTLDGGAVSVRVGWGVVTAGIVGVGWIVVPGGLVVGPAVDTTTGKSLAFDRITRRRLA